MDTDNNIINVFYKLEFEDGNFFEFDINLKLRDKNQHSPEKPSWTKLDFNKCPSCPLDSAIHSHCPAALSIVPLIKNFNKMASYEKVNCLVKDGERFCHAETSLQQAISSIMGLYLATSSCPILEKLQPMARFHLPFASHYETTYRAVSMYLLAEYFRSVNNKQHIPFSLKPLIELYKTINVVNNSLARRIKSACENDASINSLIILDVFAQMIPYEIENDLKNLEELFAPYLKQPDTLPKSA
ncbi:MAG: hypothetical protein FJ264_00700 [Planctomycetes bacterium]|nr:hypothetical protein [Planctomycetota bacterium]